MKIGSEVSALARASETPALREATTQLTEARAELARLTILALREAARNDPDS